MNEVNFMTNEEVQTDDIARIIRTSYSLSPCTSDAAKAIYNSGYRKIDNDCAVITKDELKQYKVQAVKEFVERLKNGLSNCSGCYIPNCFESPTDEFAYSEKDLLKLICELLKENEK